MVTSLLRRTLLVATGAVAAALLIPSAASAATVTAAPRSDDPTYETIARYVAAPGEVNRLLVTRVDDHTIRVADSGAVIAASGRCSSIDAHTAECTSPPAGTGGGPNWLLQAVVEAGDMDDDIRSDDVGLDADGGAGADTLSVETVIASTLDGGGGGRDVLLGGDNADVLSDGDASGETDADVMDGRAGADIVSYEQRTAPVRVDLADGAPDGEAGEADVLRSIESARGGAGDDMLAGTDDFNLLEGFGGDDDLKSREGDDSLDGGEGDDVVRGGRGGDTVEGGAGEDELLGERGNDILFPGTAGADAADCGRGFDVAAGPRRGDRLAPDCEEVRFSFGEEGVDGLGASAYPIRRDRASASFRVGCPSFEDLDGESRPVAGPVGLREAGGRRRLLGRGEITRAVGRVCGDEAGPGRLTVPVELTRLGRRRAARRDGVWATVALRGRNLPSVAWTIRLRVR